MEKVDIVYYAHSKMKYDTECEQKEIDIIKEVFHNSVIINPNGWIYNHKREDIIMEQCFRFILNSDIVVFSSIDSVVGRGVYEEVEYALRHNKEVYYLNDCGSIEDFTKKDFYKIELLYNKTKSWVNYARIKRRDV